MAVFTLPAHHPSTRRSCCPWRGQPSKAKPAVAFKRSTSASWQSSAPRCAGICSFVVSDTSTTLWSGQTVEDRWSAFEERTMTEVREAEGSWAIAQLLAPVHRYEGASRRSLRKSRKSCAHSVSSVKLSEKTGEARQPGTSEKKAHQRVLYRLSDSPP